MKLLQSCWLTSFVSIFNEVCLSKAKCLGVRNDLTIFFEKYACLFNWRCMGRDIICHLFVEGIKTKKTHPFYSFQWLHSSYYWNVWVFSISFLFIFYGLCIDLYHTPSMIFFSPLNACFSLLTMCVHSSTTCTSHNDFLMGCCTWSRFFISFAHHS